MLATHVREYIRRNGTQQKEFAFGKIERMVIDSNKPEEFMVQFLMNRASKQLGLRLLNSSKIDGKSLTKQLLVSERSYEGMLLLENIDDRQAIARQVLESADLRPYTWEETFLKHQTYAVNFEEGEQQDKSLENIRWLRSFSAWSSERRIVALRWLFESWALREATKSVTEEILETSRFIFESLSDDEASVFLTDSKGTAANLQITSQWERHKFRFATLWIRDSEISNIERSKIEQLLREIVQNSSVGSFGFSDSRQIGKLLSIRIRSYLHPEATPQFPPTIAEKFLTEGEFANGVQESLRALEINPMDDETRFGLAAIQFVQAVENLGRALYKHGAVSRNSTMPFLRLPVPINDTPSAISHEKFCKILDAFAEDLSSAEATLALIRDDHVKLRICLAEITLDFTGKVGNQTKLIDVLSKVSGRRFLFEITNPKFRVHFDRGDVAWLRAYCHLLCAMVDCYRAMDLEAYFQPFVANVFPLVEPSPNATPRDVSAASFTLKFADPTRLRDMRLHLLAVCELNPETWLHIRKEVDDDFEWLPHPTQTDHLGMPLNNQLIDSWLLLMKRFEELLTGERLLLTQPSLKPADGKAADGIDTDDRLGLNLRTLLDDPPNDLFAQSSFGPDGIVIDAKYFDSVEGNMKIDVGELVQILSGFGGPFGFGYAIRLN